MLKIIKKVKNPRFLVITPLKEGDNISRKTKETVKKNNYSFDWISYTSNNNIPTNTELALKSYEKKYDKLDYIIKIDAHTKWKKNTLDYMYITIKNSNSTVGYVYCSFEFIKNWKPFASFMFNAFDLNRLLQSNYISSNSMIKRDLLDKCPFVKDDKYVRLLDYAHWLTFAKEGYIGKLSKGYFSSKMKNDNISSRDTQDYAEKMQRIKNDFINPIIQSFN